MLKVLAYILTFLFTVAFVFLVIGIVNKLMRRPFFDGWRDRLFLITTMFVGSWLATIVLGKWGLFK